MVENPSLPKKAPQHKFIRTSTQNQPNSSLSPSKLAVTSILFSSSSCDLSNRQTTSLQRKIFKGCPKESLDIKRRKF